MTPKEKAKELVDKYKKQLDTATPTLYRPIYQAKQCALIAIDEIRSNCEWNTRLYWLEVEQEINKL